MLPLLLSSSRFAMIKEKSDPSECEAAEVRGSLPASILDRSNARIGREVFSGSSGKEAEVVDERSMGFARPPNKSPEPTRLPALRFRMGAVRSTMKRSSKRPRVRSSRVPHLYQKA